jgi:hypothetical protein
VAETVTAHAPRIYDAVVNPTPTAVVVHCGDPRFQAAFLRFIYMELGLREGQYIPLIVRGGGGAFAHPERLPKDFSFLKQRLESHQERFPSIRRIILINHQDCGYYHALSRRVTGVLDTRHPSEQMLHDLRSLGGIFARLLHHLGLTVEVYYAKFTDETQSKITFEKII